MNYWDGCPADCAEGFFIVEGRKGVSTLKCKICDPNKTPASSPGISTIEKTYLLHAANEFSDFLEKISLDIFANQYAEEIQALKYKVQAAKQRLQDA